MELSSDIIKPKKLETSPSRKSTIQSLSTILIDQNKVISLNKQFIPLYFLLRPFPSSFLLFFRSPPHPPLFLLPPPLSIFLLSYPIISFFSFSFLPSSLLLSYPSFLLLLLLFLLLLLPILALLLSLLLFLLN